MPAPNRSHKGKPVEWVARLAEKEPKFHSSDLKYTVFLQDGREPEAFMTRAPTRKRNINLFSYVPRKSARFFALRRVPDVGPSLGPKRGMDSMTLSEQTHVVRGMARALLTLHHRGVTFHSPFQSFYASLSDVHRRVVDRVVSSSDTLSHELSLKPLNAHEHLAQRVHELIPGDVTRKNAQAKSKRGLVEYVLSRKIKSPSELNAKLERDFEAAVERHREAQSELVDVQNERAPITGDSTRDRNNRGLVRYLKARAKSKLAAAETDVDAVMKMLKLYKKHVATVKDYRSE